jgi:transcription antitermination factor NusG
MADVYAASTADSMRRRDRAGTLDADLGAHAGTWHVAVTAPARERTAAAHLVGHRFGIYLPEAVETAIKRGRQVTATRPLLPGYLFVFVWDIAQHWRRIAATPGILDILSNDGHPLVVPDAAIDTIRAEENRRRPLLIDDWSWRKRGRRRQCRKESHPIDAHEIVSVHAYSALRELFVLDEPVRNQQFLRAMGLAS